MREASKVEQHVRIVRSDGVGLLEGGDSCQDYHSAYSQSLSLGEDRTDGLTGIHDRIYDDQSIQTAGGELFQFTGTETLISFRRKEVQRRTTQDGTATMSKVEPCAHEACYADSLLVTDTDTRARALAMLNLIFLKFELFENLIGKETTEVSVGLGVVPRIQVRSTRPVSQQAASRNVCEMSQVTWHSYSWGALEGFPPMRSSEGRNPRTYQPAAS